MFRSVLDYATEDIARFQFLITAAAALVAGFAATMISQPGDTLLSKVNKDKASGESAPTKPVSIDKSGIRPYKKVEKVDVKVFVSSTDKSENVVEKNGTSLDKIVSAARELGIRGLYTGTGARLIQVSVIVVTQLLMYDYIKSLVGMPVTGAGGH